MKTSLAPLLMVLFLSSPIAANAAICSPREPGLVAVTVEVDPVVEKIDTNLTELDAIAGPERRGPTLGL